MECEDCGNKEGVKETICPYAEEINGEIELVRICDDCYTERLEAI